MSQIECFAERGQVVRSKRLGHVPLIASSIEPAGGNAIPGFLARAMIRPYRGPDSPEPYFVGWFLVFH